MNLITLAQGEPWMTPSELNLNREFIRATADSLAAQGVPETALLTLRVNDVASTWLLTRRLESALTPAEGQPAPCPTPAQAGAIGKCRERLRRAIKELEACCTRDAAPVRQGLGLIEKMHEAVGVARATGILDEPAAAGERNRNHTTHNPPIPHPTQSPSPEPHQNPSPEENHPKPHPASDPPESRSSKFTPNPPGANPAEAPPLSNRKARRLQAREERRNRTGRSKAPPTMGTYPRTTPQDERHHRTASTQNEENGSGTQRGGMSRPG